MRGIIVSSHPIGELRCNRDQEAGTIRAVSFGDGRKGVFGPVATVWSVRGH